MEERRAGSRDISQFKKPEKHEDKGAREEGRSGREGGERWIGEDRKGGEQGTESRPCTQQTQMEMLCGGGRYDESKKTSTVFSVPLRYDSRFHG